MTAVHVVVPDGVDDPARPSGGNIYDRQVCRELGSTGWSVHEYPIPGAWPRRDRASLLALTRAIERIPDDAVVVLDGLIASAVPDVLVPHSRRLRLVVLVHMPLGHRPADDNAGRVRARERVVLSACAAVVTTSAWSRRQLLELYSLPADRLHVAEPGAEAAELAAGSEAGAHLLCVAAVRFDKGHDLLLKALETISDVPWRCVCVGSLEAEPAFADSLLRRAWRHRVDDRVHFPGALTGRDLDAAYAAADLVVLASRTETYGMVITEALARGVPVVATKVGGVTEALGHGAGGIRPGLLVPPADATALAAALRAWLGDAELRGRLRQAARERRESLVSWSRTASALAEVLTRATR